MATVYENLAIIVATKDREKDLSALLASIKGQGAWPEQIIVVDGGDSPLEEMLARHDFCPITYRRHKPASLPAQRNIGISLLDPKISIVAFFDDDILLEPNAIEMAVGFLGRASPETAGVCLNNISHPKTKASPLEKIFLVGADRPGAILASGFQTKICSLDEDAGTQWLIGGGTFWRREVFRTHRFDEWFYGYAHCEDVDFSYPLSKEGKLFALKDAQFVHNTKPIERRYDYPMGVMQVVNRVYFVKKHPEFPLLLCYWACFGLFLKNMFLGIFCFKPRYLSRGAGILSGIWASVFNKNRVVREEIKE